MRFVVCTDFSPAEAPVIEAATALARACHGSLVLLHVGLAEPALSTAGMAPPKTHLVPPEDRAAQRWRLEHLAKQITEAGVPAEARFSVAENAAERILELAPELEATHLVLGSHGYAAVYEILVGSTTQRVLRQAKVPVVVVPVSRVEP